eukprot:2141202-Prymnesium_polylepis.1
MACAHPDMAGERSAGEGERWRARAGCVPRCADAGPVWQRQVLYGQHGAPLARSRNSKRALLARSAREPRTALATTFAPHARDRLCPTIQDVIARLGVHAAAAGWIVQEAFPGGTLSI